MLFDVSADRGGALTILKQFYSVALEETEHTWIFVISTPSLENKKNIKIINYKWVKKSWFHRLFLIFLLPII